MTPSGLHQSSFLLYYCHGSSNFYPSRLFPVSFLSLSTSNTFCPVPIAAGSVYHHKLVVPQSYLTPALLSRPPCPPSLPSSHPNSASALASKPFPRTTHDEPFCCLLSCPSLLSPIRLPLVCPRSLQPLRDSVRSSSALWPETCDWPAQPDTGWSHSFLQHRGEPIQAVPSPLFAAAAAAAVSFVCVCVSS
ncbi:hypothetical protein LZ31DRAFT_293424 [Colletotrichum somersetense]|nr:hypothetical protein LZ31DRAFT_293424 [Colletotrichum somersetense]